MLMNTTQKQGTRAEVKNYRGTPRKVRLLADMVRGKNAKRAIAELSFTNKRHAVGVAKAIQSAVANAVNNKNINPHDLVVSDIQVSEGKAMRRFRAGSRGMAHRFKRRLSHIEVTVSTKDGVAVQSEPTVIEETDQEQTEPIISDAEVVEDVADNSNK